VLAHRTDLKKPDDNPFKEKNAAKIEKLEAQLKEARGQIDRNAEAAKDNAFKLDALDTKVWKFELKIMETKHDLEGQLYAVNLRAAAAHLDVLLVDRQFSKVEESCLEEQVQGAEDVFSVLDARYKNGRLSLVEPLEAKAGLCT
jgi:hypothetical protein